MDLVNILEFFSNDSVGMVNNMNGSGRMMIFQNYFNVLIQNVIMFIFINNIVNINSFEFRKYFYLLNIVFL